MISTHTIKYFCLFFLLLFIDLHSEEKNTDKIARVLHHFPEWNSDNVSILKLDGGQTNENYKVSLGSSSYFVRCGFRQNSLLGVSIDREWTCTSLAASAGLAPKTILFDSKEGIIVSEFIECGERQVDLHDDATKQKFCDLVRTLHHLDVEFPTSLCPLACIHHYLDNAVEAGAILPDSVHKQLLPWMEQFKRSNSYRSLKVPCHLDLYKANLLDDGSRLWLIDWEYAAMADPLFDLATAASVENFSDQEMESLLKIYFKESLPKHEDHAYFLSMRILADARWALWYYLQAQISPMDFPYHAWGDVYLQRCLDRIKSAALCDDNKASCLSCHNNFDGNLPQDKKGSPAQF